MAQTQDAGLTCSQIGGLSLSLTLMSKIQYSGGVILLYRSRWKHGGVDTDVPNKNSLKLPENTNLMSVPAPRPRFRWRLQFGVTAVTFFPAGAVERAAIPAPTVGFVAKKLRECLGRGINSRSSKLRQSASAMSFGDRNREVGGGLSVCESLICTAQRQPAEFT